ncbi:MAG: ATP-dependent DNA helicase [Gammaproteobacteria bacterium]|nr:ATP-dependent DNA helicase [Gammaproteobacteria bacterium]
MADAVEETIGGKSRLVVEAGTGTGKTYAYLVPALLSNQRVIVSTGTKALQDQLFARDLPAVLKVLNRSTKTALLKGRSNYLCRYRLEQAQTDGRFSSRDMVRDLALVRRWAQGTKSGDTAELSTIPEDAPIWPYVTSTADNCLGAECPFYEDCHVVQARRAALDAELLVVNHHLFFADLALKEEGFGELLPGAGAVIFDEAHQLAEIASLFFGEALSTRQLLELARDADIEFRTQAKDMAELGKAAEKLSYSAQDLRLAFGDELRREPWAAVRRRAEVAKAVGEVNTALVWLSECLEVAAPRAKGLEACFARAMLLKSQFARMTGDSPADQVHWFEVHARSLSLHFTPLSVAQPFAEALERQETAWVFTSATLATGTSFEHFQEALGLNASETLRLDSPFDYARQSLLYVPRGLPDTKSMGYTEAVVEAALPVLRASGGRAFFLFTSHRALQKAAELLEGVLPYPLLVQGRQTKGEILRSFRELGNAILLGTGSFWEGVDVRGEALSLVIIDKLPFAVPDDPVTRARSQLARREGRDPFDVFQLPEAVIALKQGAGRLIRDVADTGVLMLCDPRLVAREYGAVFLQSLPPMPRTRSLARVEAFFAPVLAEAAAAG